MTLSSIENADLYALRAMLNQHYQPNKDGFYLPGQKESAKSIFKRSNFRVTRVNGEADTYNFRISRVGFFHAHDVATFTYSDGAITAQPGECSDEWDSKLVSNVHKLLARKDYDQLISNLDDLVLKE